MFAALLDSWSSLYSNHAALRTAIAFTHVGGLLAGGGCAVTADLATIVAGREGPEAQALHMRLLGRTHGLVMFGLVALFLSGILLFASDFETYLYSRIFWLKMAMLAGLMVNGAVLLREERQMQPEDPAAWQRLHRTAVRSLALWVLITAAGAALPNIG